MGNVFLESLVGVFDVPQLFITSEVTSAQLAKGKYRVVGRINNEEIKEVVNGKVAISEDPSNGDVEVYFSGKRIEIRKPNITKTENCVIYRNSEGWLRVCKD